MKRNLLIIFASVFFAFSLSAQTIEGKGFASTEKAVKEYLNAICATVTMQMIYPKDNFLNQIGINLASKNRSRISAWL